MGLYDFTFYDLIDRNAICYKEKNAWLEAANGKTLTFSQYKNSVDQLACGLQKAGIEKGDRIGVIGKNGLEYFLLYGAAAALGAIMLPINWRLSAEEMSFNLNDCQPKLVFADKEFQATLEKVRKTLSSVKDCYNLGPEGGDFLDFNALMDHQGEFEQENVSSTDGFVIIHTAAVAGRPRGALVSHANILCANMQFDYLLNVSANDIHLSMLPLFHVAGLFLATTAFQAGALNVNMNKFDADWAVDLIAAQKVTMMFTFAPILSSVLEAQEKSGKDIKTLKIAAGLDSPETIEKYKQITNGNFYSLYGQTETSCVATFCAYDDAPGSAGKPLPLAAVRLVDDYDNPVPVGQVGEITVKGPMVFKGYWNLPEDNEYTFREGWHHTGDLGRFDENGYLWYAGRKAEKELIKPGGENVYPAEVEKVILQHPAVEKTVVLGVPDPKWKEAIKAVCQLKAGQSLEPKELIEFVGSRIARFKKPQHVVFIDDFPLAGDGSPDREKIKELHGEKQK